MSMEIEREKLERMLMLLAVATFHTPALQAERTELVEAGLKDLAAPVQEPVACVIDGDLYFHHEIDWEDLAYQGHGVELLYATPQSESAYQRGYLDGIGRECPHCKDYKAMYIKVRDELAAEQQVTQRQTARIVDLQTHIANLHGEE